MMGYILSNKLIFLIFVLGLLTQSCADLTIEYSIIQANWTNLTTPYNFSIKVWLDNNKSNPVVKETPYARFVVWIEPDSNYVDEYLVHTNATTINEYASIYYKAELFNSSGEHPTTTSGSNPTYAWGDPNGIHWWWGAILKSDFGDKEKQQTNVKTSIPLIAIILSIISMGYLLLQVRK
jgi:hypothetical protein